jgi:chemotaxis protein methyltransferase CheR
VKEGTVRAENEVFVHALMVKHLGSGFDREQRHVLDARLTSLARGRNLGDADALVKTLRTAPSPALLDVVIDALTTHETTFFRDGAPFRALEETVLPELLRARASRRLLHIWSAGCSTGQEPYSVAILLRERFPELDAWDVRIHATDVSKTTLDRAREGRYPERDLRRGLTPAARDKYFARDGEEYRVSDSVRRMVTWAPMNLAEPWPVTRSYDLVLMRNVLIYLQPELRSRALGRTAQSLADDGYLLLGTSETTFGSSSHFQPCSVGGSTFYRKVRE